MDEPVRILSDLHLGHRVSRIEQISALRPLIAGAGTVIFNGDTWQELARQFFQRGREMLEELKTLCHEEDAEAIFLSGNHDPGWSGPGWVELAGGRIIITHGDALLFDGSPWKREILVSGDRVLEMWNEHPEANHRIEERIRLARRIARELPSIAHPTGRSLAQRAWDAIMPPMRAVKMIESCFTQSTTGTQFCDRYFPQAEMIIIGHFHYRGSWLKNNRRVIDTGSFMAPSGSDWLEWHDGWLSRGVIDESQKIYQKGNTLEVWRF